MDSAIKDHQAEETAGRPTGTIEQELKEWPGSVHADLVAASARGQETRQKQDSQSIQRKRLLRATLILLIAFAVIIPIWWLVGTRETVEQSAPPPPSITPATSAQLESGKFEAGPPNDDSEYYRKTESKVSIDDRKILEVVQYEFRSGRFIVNNTELKNQATLVATFRSLRTELSGAWVLIFASASVENTVEHNLDLCERRLSAVKELLEKGAGLEARSYWGVLAGEFKAEETKGLTPTREEELEERLADERGEPWLTDQRKLIVVTIRAVGPLTAEAQERVPVVVERYIYDQKHLPHNYDASGNSPFELRARANEVTQPTAPRNSPNER